jgi:hypothetical protein
LYGAIFVQQSGPVPVGSGMLIEDNFVPLTIDTASYATADSQLPVQGNFADGIQVYGGNAPQVADWFNLGIPYIVTSSGFVAAGGSLTIEAGVRVRLASNAMLGSYGTLNINGLPGQEVRFGPNSASRWQTIAYYSGSSGSITGAVLESALYGLYIEYSSPAVDGCSFLNNTYGYYGGSQAGSFIHDSLFAGNDYGIRTGPNSALVIHQNSLERNFSFGVLNETTNSSIDAEDNFRGDMSGPRHASNPGGLGDSVSDWVDFDPWLAASPL